MRWSRAKTILIFVLAGVNLVFALNLVYLRSGSGRLNDQARNDALLLLAQKGIRIDEDDVPSTSGLFVLSAERDAAAEQAAVTGMLGEHTARQPGGGLSIYQAGQGEAFFRNGGFIDMKLFYGAQMKTASEAESYARELLEKSGLPVSAMRASASAGENGEWSVVMERSVLKMPVFNGDLTVGIYNSSISVTGRWFAGAEYRKGSRVKNEAALLIDIGNGIVGEAHVEGIEQGWLAVTGAGGSMLLQPAWRLTIQNRIFYLDALTGQFVTPE